MMRINYLHIAFLSLMSLQNLTAQTYCASKGNLPWNEWIAQVQFAGINHTSIKEGYGNFVTKTAIVNRGSSYPMTVTKGFSWAGDPSNAPQQGRVWIDFNQNGTFETTELVASFHRNATTANITIPTTATLGNTRMRIALKTIGIPTPCEIFDRGEVEDYTINISGGTTPCTSSRPPTFSNCPSNIVATATNGQCVRGVWTAPTVNATGLPVTVSSNFESGYCFPVGVTTVRYTATDSCRNTGTCAFTVTITSPIIGTDSCRRLDSLQLVNLYHATNGANWQFGWDFALPLHLWYGVTLTNRGCVQRLELPRNQLFGTLPNLNLPKLEYLYLSDNELSGNLPAFNLPELNYAVLLRNQFSGNLPIFNCPKLAILDLAANRFTGAIPNFNYPQLDFLSLSENQLTGSIPNFNLPNLTELVLSENQLTGTIPNFNFPKIRRIQLSINRLTGSIPNFNLPTLQDLFLDVNQLSGSIPAFNLPVLQNLQLSGNQLSGCLPVALKSLCGQTVTLTSNPNLATQDFAAFCSLNNTGMCASPFNCVSKGNTPWNQWITNVKFVNINNNSLKEGYGNFTNVVTHANRGANYPFALTQGYSWAADPTNATAQWRVWIDYNRNNIFDANELAASGTRTTSTATIAIPATASLGATKMRVSFKKTGAPTACEVFENGEVEDYTINIMAGLGKAQNIDNQDVTNSNIFPNPTANEAFLDLKDFENERIDITISDIAGKPLWKQTVEKASVSPHRLNTSNLKNGTYFIEIQSIEKSITLKLYILN